MASQLRLGCDVWLSRPKSLARWIKFARLHRLTDVEIIVDRDEDGTLAAEPIPPALAAEARACAEDAEVRLAVCASVYNFGLGDASPAWAARCADAVRRALEFAVAAGAQRVGVRTDADGGLGQARRRARFAEHAARLGAEARAAGVVIALENLHDPVPLFVSLLGLEELRGWQVLWNLAHAHAFGGPAGLAAGAGDLFGRRLCGFSLSDNRGNADDHLAIGRGTVDVRGFLGAVWATRRELPIFLEIHRGADLIASLRTVRRWARSV